MVAQRVDLARPRKLYSPDLYLIIPCIRNKPKAGLTSVSVRPLYTEIVTSMTADGLSLKKKLSFLNGSA